MRAAVYRSKGVLDVTEVAEPTLGPADVLVEVSHCGICGTDLHMVMDGWGRPGSIGGHEYSGRILAMGSAVGGWHVGDTIVATPQLEGCGACRSCERGRPSLCAARGRPGMDAFQGAFAERVRVDHRQLVRLPEGLSLRDAALCEPLAVAQHAVTLSRAAPGERALVCGAGPIGALVVALLRALGIDDVRVSEPGAARRALAARLGAHVVEPADLIAPPLPFDVAEDAVDIAFECSGTPSAIEASLAQLARGGRLVLVGTAMEHPKLDANRVLLNELVVTGAFNYDAGGFERAIELLATGRLPVETLVEPDDAPLEGLLGAINDLAAGRRAGKVLVRPGH